MLSLFYTKRDLALRTVIFYFGNYFATATGSLIAAGVLRPGVNTACRVGSGCSSVHLPAQLRTFRSWHSLPQLKVS